MQVFTRSTGISEVPFVTITTAYERNAYGCVPPSIDLEQYLKTAQNCKVIIELSGTSDRRFKLTGNPSVWSVPFPEEIESNLENLPNWEIIWRELMTWLVCYMNGKQKKRTI